MEQNWLEQYLLAFPGAEHDYKIEWCLDRYMVRGKLFAATMAAPEGMKDEQYNGHPLMNLKCDPGKSELLRTEFSDILPGFYCDKKTWIAVRLDGDISDDLLRELCDDSYHLIFEKLPKYVQKEITDGEQG